MTSTSRIAELASLVTTNTAIVDEYLKANKLPQPSFDVDGPFDLNLKDPKVEEARIAAMDASNELQDLLMGTSGQLRPVLNSTSLEAIYKYQIPSKVPIHGEISFDELAEKCGMFETDMRRIVRFAICFHRIFQELRPGYVSHSAASRRLVEDKYAMDGVGLMFDGLTHSFCRTTEALLKWRNQEPTESGHSIANNTDKYFYDWLGSNPDKAKRFANSMEDFSNTYEGHSPVITAREYNFSALGDQAVLVDVGGGKGFVSFEIAKRHPNLKFVVQDRPETIKNGIADCPADMKDRVEFMPHDFIANPQTVKAQAYLFRWIFHNWPDKYCVKILQNTIPALQPGARVLIVDHLAPGPGELPLSAEKAIRAMDMIQLTLFNARERETHDWQKLFESADKRFGPVKVHVHEGSAFAVIESVWQG